MTVYARPGTSGSAMSFQSRYDNFIGGDWVAPVGGEYFANPTPVTGEAFCEVAWSTEAGHREGPRRRACGRTGLGQDHRPSGR